MAIDFYSGLDKPDQAWAMLSPHARAVYGSKQDFVAYWKKLLPISARDANGVAPNQDGSVTVPVTVVFGYGPDSHTKDTKLRVTRLDGNLTIDSDTRP